MKICALAAVALAWNANAETICALGKDVSAYKPAQDQRPSSDALQLAGRVNAAVKAICGNQCPTMALFRNPTAPNLLLINNSGEARLVYAPQFLNSVQPNFGDEGVLAVIAHELGHALDSTRGANFVKNTWPPEVRADAWSGCVLAKLDLSQQGLNSALAALEKYPAPAHPAWSQRRPALRAGFTACGGEGAKFDKGK
ncbi:MAG TPA: hypothetical protein VH639_01995 [Bryobacteraceae bacterium]|jgi:hypothetical protein